MNVKNQAIQNVQRIQKLEKELAREAEKVAELRKENAALKEKGRALVHHLVEHEIELAREVWGNTNTNLIINHRNKLAELLK